MWVLPQVVTAAPLYTRAQQHQAGSKARATSIREKALAHAVIADRAGFLAVRGPTHLRDWGTKLASRTGQLEAAIVRSQPHTIHLRAVFVAVLVLSIQRHP